MSRLALSLLGAFQATLDGAPIPFRSVKARALLAYLAVESERPHRREILAALLWPEESERVANNNFRQTLSSLRKAIGDRDRTENPVLLVTRETVQFNCASDCWLDVHALQEMVKDDSPGTSSTMLTEAVSLYRGDFLEGFFVRDSVAFEDWTLLITRPIATPGRDCAATSGGNPHGSRGLRARLHICLALGRVGTVAGGCIPASNARVDSERAAHGSPRTIRSVPHCPQTGIQRRTLGADHSTL